MQARSIFSRYEYISKSLPQRNLSDYFIEKSSIWGFFNGASQGNQPCDAWATKRLDGFLMSQALIRIDLDHGLKLVEIQNVVEDKQTIESFKFNLG